MTDTIVVPVGKWEEGQILDSRQFHKLRALGFVHAKTDQHQWYLLVQESCAKSGVNLEEPVRAYLAMMLWRFTNRVHLVGELEAFDFYQYLFGKVRFDESCYQDLADISLQYVAFFPERARYRHQARSLEHVVRVGMSLYETLARASAKKDDCTSEAHRLMSRSFMRAVFVLQSVCPQFAVTPDQLLGRLTPQSTPLAPQGRGNQSRLRGAVKRFNGLFVEQAAGTDMQIVSPLVVPASNTKN